MPALCKALAFPLVLYLSQIYLHGLDRLKTLEPSANAMSGVHQDLS
jgi:hypothetical protein